MVVDTLVMPANSNMEAGRGRAVLRPPGHAAPLRVSFGRLVRDRRGVGMPCRPEGKCSRGEPSHKPLRQVVARRAAMAMWVGGCGGVAAAH